MRHRTVYRYVVQERLARVREWYDYPHAAPFKRHKDANDLGKSLVNSPDNRGHDRYYRVQRREETQ